MTNHLRAWLVAITLAIFAAQAYGFYDLRQDDPFISLRYGQNLATGQGLTFNPGERFLGATSPLHMLLAALVYRAAGRDATPSLMSGLGCAAWAAQAVATYALFSPSIGAPGAALVALAIALGAARSFMWVPFETNFVAAFSLFALVSAQRRRWLLAAVHMALACLFRPDALLLALLLLGLCVREQRRRAIAPASVFALLTLPWVAFATAYYGSPLPHSAVEKFQRSSFTPYLEHAFLQLGETLLPFTHGAFPAALAWLLCALGAWWLWRRDRVLGLLGPYALCHLLAYLVLRPFVGHDWHLYPLNLFAVLSAYGGVAVLVASAVAVPLRRAGWLGFVLIALLLAWRTTDEGRSYARAHWTGFRDATYRKVAAYLRAHASPGDHFASIEVGTLAFYSELPAYDLGGLVTDLRQVNMIDRPVRWLVLDQKYMAKAPPWAPVFSASEQDFTASVFYLPAIPTARRSP